MPDGVSIFEVIKRGGYEASLITTFNATLPFYEEVVLRKLASAGCRHNVVLMDRRQCALAWDSEASRPRLAGYRYTLLPVGVRERDDAFWIQQALAISSNDGRRYG